MKNIIGTKNAFREMLKEKNVHKIVGLSAPTVSNWRRAIEGKGDMMPTIDKMEDILIRFGAEVASEKSWMLPIVNNFVNK